MNATGGIEAFLGTLLRRRRLLLAPPGPADPARQAIFFAELHQMGYKVSNPGLYSDALLDFYQPVMETLSRIRGGQVAHVPLYSGFPDNVPDEGDYLLRRLLGYVLQHSRWNVPGRELKTGFTVPEWLFDLELFGADPVSQFQDATLFMKAKWAQFRRRTEKPKPAIQLTLVTPEEAEEALATWAQHCLKSKTSYPEEYRKELAWVVRQRGTFGLTAQEMPFREHRAMVSGALWRSGRLEEVGAICQTPTDLLRMFAELTGSDQALVEPITFPRFTRAQRRCVLSILEEMMPPLLVEDELHRYRRLWLAVERSLHSGEYAKLFPKIYLLFRRLQRRETRPRFRELEVSLTSGSGEAIRTALRRLPGGVSVRRFAHCLAAVESDQREAMLEALLPQVQKGQLKDQLMLRCVLERDGWADKALILTKRGATQVIPRDPDRLPPEFRSRCLSSLDQTLNKTVQEKFGEDSWAGKKVFIEPALARWVLPLALRSASDALTVLGRGTRIPLTPRSTVRLFVYWRQRFRRTDLDLSAVTFDQEGRCTGFVDWTQLKGKGLVHSGDLQSAPLGAAEFIDANVEQLRNFRSTRYLAALVFRYCGDNFGSMECFTGWMMRDKPDARYKTFDIGTVEQKISLAGSPSYSLPFLIDLKEMEAIWLDLSIYSVAQHAQVANSYQRLEQLVAAGMEMPRWRPTLNSLAQLHLNNRGAQQVPNREEADIVFALDSKADYSPQDWSKVLSELL